MRVGRVALGARDAQPFPVPCRLQRVDRQHPVPGGDRRLHPQATAGLDPDHHLRLFGRFIELFGDHRVQLGHPHRSLGQAGLGQPAPRGIHQLDVVMLLGPVLSHEQAQRFSRFRHRSISTACGRTVSELIKQCSHRYGWARHPSGDQLSRPTSGGTIFARDSRSSSYECSPARGCQARVCRSGGLVKSGR